MSVAALTWAFGLNLKPATAKFVLVALADNADDEGRAFPSVESLISKTSLDRKTVIRALDELEQMEVLTDTGSRVGRTKQVKVYRLTWKRPESGSVRTASQRVPDSEHNPVNGTVPEIPPKGPVFPSKGPVFPSKESQKRDTEPSGNPQEPSGNRGRSRKALPTPLRGSRLPSDFALTSERRQVAEAEALDADRVFASFCDYWRSATGAKARKCDWDATWRNWCRAEQGRGGVLAHRRKTFSDYEREAEARRANLPGEDPGPL